MNLNQKLICIAGTVAGTYLVSAQAAPPACDPRLLGTWEVDMSKTTAPSQPKSMTFT
jgi:hypothetical protein